MTKIYGYCRCSTNEEMQDIKRQERELIELGALPTSIYKEYVSGASDNKVELMKLLDIAQEGDTIVTTEISRLSRSTKQLIDLIDIVKSKKLKLIIKNSIVIDCTQGKLDPMTNAFLQISGVFAELERNMISERVKSGMANAKERGAVIGRPSLTVETIPKNFMKNYVLYRKGAINKSQLAKICDMTRQSVYKYIKMLEN